MIILTITDDDKSEIIADGMIAKVAEEQAKKRGVSVTEVLKQGLIRFLQSATTPETKGQEQDKELKDKNANIHNKR